MRIAIVGTGGVGAGYRGGAGEGRRGCHLHRARRASGGHAARRIEGFKPARRYPSGADTGDRKSRRNRQGRFRAVCVKLWDVESAGISIKPLIGPDTAVIPLQNGVDAAERLIPILGPNAVMGGVAQIGARSSSPA